MKWRSSARGNATGEKQRAGAAREQGREGGRSPSLPRPSRRGRGSGVGALATCARYDVVDKAGRGRGDVGAQRAERILGVTVPWRGSLVVGWLRAPRPRRVNEAPCRPRWPASHFSIHFLLVPKQNFPVLKSFLFSNVFFRVTCQRVSFIFLQGGQPIFVSSFDRLFTDL